MLRQHVDRPLARIFDRSLRMLFGDDFDLREFFLQRLRKSDLTFRTIPIVSRTAETAGITTTNQLFLFMTSPRLRFTVNIKL